MFVKLIRNAAVTRGSVLLATVTAGQQVREYSLLVCRVSRKQQFKAILRKNFLLQTRGRKSFLGLEGWAALLFELLVPAAFFLLMCIPRHEIQPMPHPREVAAPADLDASSYGSWAQSYDGMMSSVLYRCASAMASTSLCMHLTITVSTINVAVVNTCSNCIGHALFHLPGCTF